ncbi:MAG: 2-isopropylmalate synthase [Chlamydiae bacterium]|nr:2-isopropylmalate synthase [Chlamydiota bacterium]
MTERLIVFDTTLRDGEQCPGASLNEREKVEIALQLARLGVDAIEAGFPVASPGDFEAVRAIAAAVKGPIIAGLSRALPKDIEAAARALEKAKRPRIHVFLATSGIHRRYKLKKAKGEILKLAAGAVRLARRYVDDIEFSPEDASRTEPAFLAEVVEAVIAAGAGTVNIPDTVGYSMPGEFGRLVRYLREHVPSIDKAVLSVHCHNDLGLGVANSLAAIVNGARQVECTINGIGERAGNASLEEIVMAVRTRPDIYRVSTGVVTRQIWNTSRLVSRLTGMPVQPNKAVVGDNAFAHESGIHQDGMLKNRRTYEIMTPESVGWRGTSMVMGKHSGSHAFAERLKQLGHVLPPKEFERAFRAFKELADKKKAVFDDDLLALIDDQISAIPEEFRLDYISISSGNKTLPTATIRLRRGDKLLQDAACGDGPVDAAMQTIRRITKIEGRLADYSLRAVTGGTDALGEVTVKVSCGRFTETGRGTSTDVIEASAKAYLNALNRILWRRRQRKARAAAPRF